MKNKDGKSRIAVVVCYIITHIRYNEQRKYNVSERFDQRLWSSSAENMKFNNKKTKNYKYVVSW